MHAGTSIETVALKVAIKACAADSQNLGGAEAVAIAHLENFLNVRLADFVEGAMLQVFREIAEIDEISGGGDARGGNRIFEFAEISRPGMLKKDDPRVRFKRR